MSTSEALGHKEPKLQVQHPAGGVGYVLGLLAAVLLLYIVVAGLPAMPCIWVLPLIAFAAYPLWRYQTDRILLERRAILTTVATPTGRLWNWFWRGRFAAVLQVFVALILAAVLLVMLTPLQRTHWMVLAIDALLLAIAIPLVRRILGSQVREGYIGLVARRWPLTALNVLILVAGFVYVDFALLGWPDTRDLPWATVAESAFRSAQESTTCGVLGAGIGAVETVAALGRHFASRVIPSLPARSVKTVAWVVFLAWTGFGAYLYTRLLLGVVALMDRIGGHEAGADDRTTRAFVYTILALAIPFTYAYIKYEAWETTPRVTVETEQASTGAEATEQPVVDPCAGFNVDTEALQANASAAVSEARSEAIRQGEEQIDATLEQAFSAAEEGVDEYLDWYYTLRGEYSRLGQVLMGDMDEFMTEKLQEHVVAATGFDSILKNGLANLESQAETLVLGAAGNVHASVIEEVKAALPCRFPTIDPVGVINIRPDVVRATVATAAGGGVAIKVMAARPATAVAGKLAARGTVKLAGKALAKTAAKTTAKKGATVLATLGASGTATASCGFLGPFAPVCGVGAGVVTWLAVDKTFVEVEERFRRDDLRVELMAGLNEERAELREQLVAAHTALVDAYSQEIQERVDKVFIPGRDGV